MVYGSQRRTRGTSSAMKRARDEHHIGAIWTRVLGLSVGISIFVALVTLVAIVTVLPVAAHADLAASDPPADGLLTVSPDRILLTFTEPVSTDAGYPRILLIDDQGRAQEVGAATVSPDRMTEVTVDVPDLSPGTYTVSWSVLSDTDGHTLSGGFAFRVGGGRAPTGTTVEGGDPQAWAVTTRWLTFLGAALLAGGGIFALIISPTIRASVAVARMIAIGAAVALIATGLEPVLSSLFPPDGAGDPSLQSAIDALPNAWWLRSPALLVGCGMAVAWWWAARNRTAFSSIGVTTVVGSGLVALLGLSLTGHGAGRDSWRWLAVGSDILHQWSIAIWTGGLIALVLSGASRDGESPGRIGGRALLGFGSRSGGDPVSRFSRLALPLVIVGVTTGVLNAGLVLPALQRLVDTTYGRVLIAKVVVLLPVLILATFHRTRIRSMSSDLAALLRPTLRVETALVVLIVLGGSLLALMSPPQSVGSASRGTDGNGDAPDVVDLAAPIDAALGDAGPALHLQVDPVQPGENQVGIYLAAPAQPPAPLTRILFAVGATVAVSFTSLSHAVAPVATLATPDGGGGFRVSGLKLSLDGWWRIEVVVRQGREPEIRRDFTILLPDPNIHGSDAVRLLSTDEAARAIFERGIAGIAGLHRLRYTQRLSDGSGNFALIEFAVSDGTDGNPPARVQSTGRVAIISIGDREWLQRSDGAWTERKAGFIAPPSDAVGTYAGATAFALGPVERVGADDARVVSFYVPATRVQSAAWFTWWVAVESGHVLRETMVARSHYMLTDYRDFDASMVIEPPVIDAPAATPDAAATPSATASPAASPAASPVP